jgi:two-component system alkaline phosphatase synthesis response regulator PhoP
MVWRILLVEDEENLQEVIKMNLELEGYEVIAVDNGLDALRLAKEQRFNLVVLDVMLPEMDGFHVCEQIRLDDPNIPVFVFDRQRLNTRQNYRTKKRR